jgi:Domain of unknown function (DUF4419)
MTDWMEKRIMDADLLWVMSDFTPTSDVDRVTTSVLMIGAMQKYFPTV